LKVGHSQDCRRARAPHLTLFCPSILLSVPFHYYHSRMCIYTFWTSSSFASATLPSSPVLLPEPVRPKLHRTSMLCIYLHLVSPAICSFPGPCAGKYWRTTCPYPEHMPACPCTCSLENVGYYVIHPHTYA